jgi:DNA-binding NtrC family response regulator
VTAPNTHVLIAEDDVFIAIIIERIVQHMGLTPIVVSDGDQVVEAVRSFDTRLACVICDMMMPVMSGLEAAVAIRAFNLDVPIVLMSASNYVALARQAALMPRVSFMQKPFRLDYLQSLLDQMLHAYEPRV